MELIFNELSATTPCLNFYDANRIMKQFAETVNLAAQKGFRNVRSHLCTSQIILADNYSIYDWLNDRTASKDHKDFLFGKFILPFINEDDEAIEEEYISANYYFESTEHNIPKNKCLGLASAYLYNTLSISLPMQSVWERFKLPLIIEQAEEVSDAEVFNVAAESSFLLREIIDFIENIGELILIEIPMSPDDKECHIAGDHHGNPERHVMWGKIKQNPYVVSMRSTGGFGTGRFIRKIFNDGHIEIVLEGKYSVLVQTTGRNCRETKAIAKILDDNYS